MTCVPHDLPSSSVVGVQSELLLNYLLWSRYRCGLGLQYEVYVDSVVTCLRGSRSRRNHVPRTSLDLAVHEGHFPLVG